MSQIAKGVRVQITPSLSAEYEAYAGQFVTVMEVNSLMVMAQADDGKWLYLYREEIVQVSE